MNVWIVTSGEPLPLDQGGVRLLRHGILASMLATRGWQVTWWTADFDHTAKRNRRGPQQPEAVELPGGQRIWLLRSRGYARNLSLRRVLDHRDLAANFLRSAPAEPRPDVILASYPPIELAAAAARFGKAHGVPVAVDVRDLWPDIFAAALPRPLRILAAPVLALYDRQARRALASASALLGITGPIVDWACAKAGRVRRAADRDFPLACTPPDPVDAAAVAAALTQWATRGLTRERFVVCFFGALGDQFDFATVLQAARQLETQQPDILFVLCGQGHALPMLEAHAAGHANVLAPGWQQRAELHALLHLSSVGLAPYVNEYSFTLSVPNKIIEFFSGGLPVLSSLKGQTQDLLAQNACGITYAEGDPDSLAAELLRLRSDAGLRARMGLHARLLFETRYTAQHVYGDMIDHLAALAAAPRGAGAAMASAETAPR